MRLVPWTVGTITIALGCGALAPGEGATRRHERQEALRPTDIRFEQLVSAALAADPVVESFEIVVTVMDGSVRLYGTVDTDEERARAGAVAGDVEGVVDVENQITVERTLVAPGRDEDEIRRLLLDEIAESFPEESENIEVNVDDIFATLTGVVSTSETRRALTEIAFRAGALLVKNQIRIEPK